MHSFPHYPTGDTPPVKKEMGDICMKNKNIYPNRYYANEGLKTAHFLTFLTLFVATIMTSIYISERKTINPQQAEHIKLLAKTKCTSEYHPTAYLRAYFKTHSIEEIKSKDYKKALALLELKPKYENQQSN